MLGTLGGGGLWGLGGGSRSAREGDGGNLDAAGRLRLASLRRVDNGDTGGTTALVVLDDGSLVAARRSLLALLTAGHVIVELEVARELGLHVNLTNGELVRVLAGLATERRRGAGVTAADTADGLAASARSEATSLTLAEAVLAGPALEVEATIVGEATSGEIIPRETTALLVGALVVSVGRAAEATIILEAEAL